MVTVLKTENDIQSRIVNLSKFHKNLSPEYEGKKKLSLSKKMVIFNQIIKNFNELICEILQVKKLPPVDLENIIQGTIFNSLKDQAKKYQDKNYYLQNANALNYVAERMIQVIKSKKRHSKLALYNFAEIINKLSFDSILLIQRAAEFKNIKFKRSIWKSEVHRDYDMIRGLKILLYGQDSLQFIFPNVPDSSLGIIRIAIENRIRSATGCYGVVNKDNSIGPLDLSVIFDKLIKYKDCIKFGIKLENIVRIYKWTNMYVHAGSISYFWCPYIIYDYLAPLFIGGKTHTGYSIYAGIQMPENVIYKIWSEIENEISKARLIDKMFFRKTNGRYLYRVADSTFLNAIILK